MEDGQKCASKLLQNFESAVRLRFCSFWSPWVVSAGVANQKSHTHAGVVRAI